MIRDTVKLASHVYVCACAYICVLCSLSFLLLLQGVSCGAASGDLDLLFTLHLRLAKNNSDEY